MKMIWKSFSRKFETFISVFTKAAYTLIYILMFSILTYMLIYTFNIQNASSIYYFIY